MIVSNSASTRFSIKMKLFLISLFFLTSPVELQAQEEKAPSSHMNPGVYVTTSLGMTRWNKIENQDMGRSGRGERYRETHDAQFTAPSIMRLGYKFAREFAVDIEYGVVNREYLISKNRSDSIRSITESYFEGTANNDLFSMGVNYYFPNFSSLTPYFSIRGGFLINHTRLYQMNKDSERYQSYGIDREAKLPWADNKGIFVPIAQAGFGFDIPVGSNAFFGFAFKYTLVTSHRVRHFDNYDLDFKTTGNQRLEFNLIYPFQ